jgi:primosomal protein N'
VFSAQNNIEKFFAKEFEMRKQLNYPPFNRLSKIEMQSMNLDELTNFSKIFFANLPNNQAGFQFIGPVFPNVPRLARYYRQFIFVKSSKKIDRSGEKLNIILHNTLQKIESNIKNIRINIDIDSYQNM